MGKLFSFHNKKNQQQLFEQLLEPHFDYLYRLAYRFCDNQDDAQDLVQELLIRLYPKTADLQQVEQLRPWLTKSLYYLFIDRIRAQSRNPTALADQELEPEMFPTHASADPQISLDHEASLEQVAQAFSQLSEEHRSLITLHDMEGYTLPELQTMLDVPIGTLKSRLHRGRNRLQQILQQNMTSDDHSAEPNEHH